MKSAAQQYTKLLKENHVSNTKQRKIVFNTLSGNNHKPISMNELLNLTSKEIDRSSAYRAVEILEKIGVIKRINIGWKYKLELSDEFGGHHHHITCIKCGNVHATHDNEQLEKLIFDMAKKCGYKAVDHHVEINAICQKCQNI